MRAGITKEKATGFNLINDSISKGPPASDGVLPNTRHYVLSKLYHYSSSCQAGKLDEIHRLVDQVVKQFGRIDILVNNAGGSPANASCLEAEERLWDTIINLNLKGVYFLS
jgi:NAD(P)-dependent dehydrogenase (short-subunit alcohol dehydrogenase family)